MKDKYFHCDKHGIECYIEGALAVLKTGGSSFQLITDIEHSENMLNFYDKVESDPSIKVLLMVTENESYGSDAYHQFLSDISGKDLSLEQYNKIDAFEKKLLRIREITMLHRFILKAVNFQKILVTCLRGTVVTPFFGASLASDFRLASETMSFSLAHIKYGLHPSGALPFFLPKYVGQGKASEILFGVKDISAKEALDLGLISKIIPSDRNYTEACIEEANRLSHIDFDVMRSTKRFLTSYKPQLERFIELESRYVER